MPPRQGEVDALEDRRERQRRIGLLAGGLDVDPDRADAAGRLEVALQPHQRGGLARLPAGVQGKVLVILDELQHAPKAALGREHIMLARDAGACDVERGPHGGAA